MTSSSSRRVMMGLSLLRRFTLLAPALVTFVHVPSASAQVPVFGPAEPVPAPEVAPVTEPAAPETAPSPTPAVPPTPPPRPSGPDSAPRAAPSLDQRRPPPPAKTDHIAEQEAADELAAESEEDDAEYDEAGEPRRRWYGWQTLIADGSAVGLLLTAAAIEGQHASDTDVLITAALLGYEFAPGIIHFAHRNTGRGFASFGLRLGMPLAGAFVGAATASGCDDYFCEVQGAAIGTLLGVAGAMAIDAAVFAYEDRRPRGPDAQLVPLLAISREQAWLGIGGAL